MRNIHSHELALVSGGIIESPSDELRRELEQYGDLSNYGGLTDYGAWATSSANTASPSTAMQMIGTGAFLAAFGMIALATIPFATAAGLTVATVGLTSVGGIANLGGIAWAGYGWSLLNKPGRRR